MGLDMYLTAKKDFYPDFGDINEKEENLKTFSKLLSGAGITVNEIDSEFPTSSVSFKVGYWRKANAIHAWFVKHCQAGVDDCNSYSVSRKNLIDLKDSCTAVLADNSKANSLLPPQAGFFFGSTEVRQSCSVKVRRFRTVDDILREHRQEVCGVNEYYLDDLKLTVKIIDRSLRERLSNWNFSYNSSW